MDKFKELEEKAKEIMKRHGAIYTGFEVEEEDGEKVIFIGGRIPYEPNYIEKEKKIKEELLKELGSFDYEIIVGLVPEHSSDEERKRVMEEMFNEFKALVS